MTAAPIQEPHQSTRPLQQRNTYFLLVLYATAFQEHAQALFEQVQQWIITNASWFYILAVALVLISLVFLTVSRYGDIKLGPDYSEPDYRKQLVRHAVLGRDGDQPHVLRRGRTGHAFHHAARGRPRYRRRSARSHENHLFPLGPACLGSLCQGSR